MFFMGHDWAEDHHDISVINNDGRWVASARVPEGIAGVTRLQEMLAGHDIAMGDIVVHRDRPGPVHRRSDRRRRRRVGTPLVPALDVPWLMPAPAGWSGGSVVEEGAERAPVRSG
ncbi:MAG: hypothetical protein ACR2MN_01280 [Acidimicrobiales bacterium]